MSRRRNEPMASNNVRHGRECSDKIEETSSDEGLLLRPKPRSKRDSRNYTVSHMQQHTCHSLCVIVVVMSRWRPYVRWCAMTAAFDFFKCCGTGIGNQSVLVREWAVSTKNVGCKEILSSPHPSGYAGVRLYESADTLDPYSSGCENKDISAVRPVWRGPASVCRTLGQRSHDTYESKTRMPKTLTRASARGTIRSSPKKSSQSLPSGYRNKRLGVGQLTTYFPTVPNQSRQVSHWMTAQPLAAQFETLSKLKVTHSGLGGLHRA